MSLFTRLADIVGANLNSMLDRAEDPEKIARMIVQEMEDTLVEVRANVARAIADRKDLQRKLNEYEAQREEWEAKAALALEKGREDLARGAIAQKQRALQASDLVLKALAQTDDVIAKTNDDMRKLNEKLEEAREKHRSYLLRKQAAEDRLRVRRTTSDRKLDEAYDRYATMERRVDRMEAEAEVMAMSDAQSLKAKFAELDSGDEIERELAELKSRLANKG